MLKRIDMLLIWSIVDPIDYYPFLNGQHALPNEYSVHCPPLEMSVNMPNVASSTSMAMGAHYTFIRDS